MLFTDQAIVSGIGPGSRQALKFRRSVFSIPIWTDAWTLLQTNGQCGRRDQTSFKPSQHYETADPAVLELRSGLQSALRADGSMRSSVTCPGRWSGRGAAFGDLDDDGDLDVVITQINRPPTDLSETNQQLGASLVAREGRGPRGQPRCHWCPPATVLSANGCWNGTVMPTRSYLTQVELPVTFGLAEQTRVERLLVTWPDGESVELTDLPADQVIDVAYPSE